MRSYALDAFDEEHEHGEDAKSEGDGDQIHGPILGPRSEGVVEKRDQRIQIL
jgi:hypothetical protein